MTISTRIIAGFAAITLILLLLGGYALNQIGSVRTTVDLIVQRDIGAMRQLDGVQASLARMVEMRTGAVRQELLGASEGDVDFADQWRVDSRKAAAALDTMRANTAEYRERAVTDDRAEQWRIMGERLDMARTVMGQLRGHVETQLTAIRAGDRPAVLAAEPQIVRDRAALLEQVVAIRGILDRAVDAGRAASQEVYERSRVSIAIALFLATAISIGVAWTIRRSIVGPLGGFMAFVERVGTGDLSGDAAVTGEDEIGRLGRTLNGMVEGLRGIARQSREATENLNAATTEIRASTQQQAASVEEQLAAVQETAATVDEITHSGSQISRRAQDVIAAARATADTTGAGVAAVEDTVKAMDAIRAQAEAVAANIVALSEKTQAIGEIIATVNDVSERTHLLALNAAIEAAAAGEAGRSFAIVATEMKTLADQAKGATRDVRGLLGDIQRGINASVMLTEEAVKRVEAGKQQTDTAQAAIEDMGTRVQDSVQTFQQIVASTNQQQIGIEQVTIALQNIRQASQQTAASTRQLDQAAGDLAGLARQLVGQTERYRL